MSRSLQQQQQLPQSEPLTNATQKKVLKFILACDSCVLHLGQNGVATGCSQLHPCYSIHKLCYALHAAR
jgi:hypothetical protein